MFTYDGNPTVLGTVTKVLFDLDKNDVQVIAQLNGNLVSIDALDIETRLQQLGFIT